MRTVALVLGANPIDSKVIVDGFDVTSMCTGVDVHAHVGEVTRITLHMIGHCEVLADVPEIEIDKPKGIDE